MKKTIKAIKKEIYKDNFGNVLFINGDIYYAKNEKGEILSKHGLYSMMKEKGISTKKLEEIYIGKRRNK